jgi:hypothetical protein
MRAALFPGFIATLLAARVRSAVRRGAIRAQRLWLAVGIAGLLLSFGRGRRVSVLLYHLVPLLQGIRAPVRFGYLALAAVAALAGFGLALPQSARLDVVETAEAIGVAVVRW